MKGLSYRSQRATAAVDAERHCPVLVPIHPLDQRVLHASITQVVNQRVAEAVEGLPGIGDALLRLVATKTP